MFELTWNDSLKNVQEKIVEVCYGVLKNKKSFSISFLNHITKFCDCNTRKDKVLLDDIGIVAGADPVAVDQASIDIVNKIYGKNFIKELYPDIDYTVQLDYAQRLGIGSRDYELVEY